MIRNSTHRLSRGLLTFLSAGALLQAGGCVTDPTELFGGLFSSVLNNVLANFVFGAFGLAA